jgi:CRP-like cAMP-binding protein
MQTSRLRSIPLFADLSDEQLRKIAPFAEEKRVDKGTELVREGDYSYEFMFIEEGTAEVARGGEHVADLGPGDFFGEIGLLEKDLRTATVKATSDMSLITLTGWDLDRVRKAMPEAYEQIQRALEERKPIG